MLIKPGSRVPLDGTVREGQSAIDQAMVTGEPEPIEATAGTKVYAGTINQTYNAVATLSVIRLGQ